MAEELEKRGIKCTIIAGGGRQALLKILKKIPFHDVIFFQKNASKWHVRLMGLANSLGKITIFDLDDAPSRINSPVTLKNAGKMMANASAVIAGSQPLLGYAKEYIENAFYLPTCVKLENYAPLEKKAPGKTVCLGWIGNGPHYAEDLIKILSGPLQQVGAAQQVRFKLVGACGDRRLYNAFSNIAGVEAELIDQIPWGDSEAVRNQLADFDIGLYPILPNAFNENKCGFKALEYMAMGIPVIASPVGVLCDIIEHSKDGLLPDSEDGWANAIAFLSTASDKRKIMGKKGRLKVETEYDIGQHADFLLNVITCLRKFS
ncbi:MAG: glycosyltransferase family 4 protein [Candidatus Electrothrix sp. GW3-4]|uniref:glycosyltransferase family 4 protein n=1 Tax=Candidatus Electrothrix sp. GW3-4 TaxID=3126740 RepID=UPI0030D3CEF3